MRAPGGNGERGRLRWIGGPQSRGAAAGLRGGRGVGGGRSPAAGGIGIPGCWSVATGGSGRAAWGGGGGGVLEPAAGSAAGAGSRPPRLLATAESARAGKALRGAPAGARASPPLRRGGRDLKTPQLG